MCDHPSPERGLRRFGQPRSGEHPSVAVDHLHVAVHEASAWVALQRVDQQARS